MRLYAGTTAQFVEDTVRNQIAEKLKNAFFEYYRFAPGQSEVNSWRNSLRATAQVFQHARLTDTALFLEYQLPLSSRRLDCMISGRDRAGCDNAVIMELKQWEKADEADGDNEVTAWVGGARREVLHPSAQVSQYQMYLKDTQTVFYEGGNPVNLYSCAYLHNYSFAPNDPLLADKFRPLIKASPVFGADDVDELEAFLKPRFVGGHGNEVLGRIDTSEYRPSKKLMDHVGNIIKGQFEYVLLDEQLVAYDRVLACTKKGFHDKQTTVIIVKGGPGTGKSVIAINLLADLSLKGYNAQYVTGSIAFTQTLKKVIGPRGAVQFKYTSSYEDTTRNAVDVLVVDEAHRIRERTQNRFTPRHKRSGLLQVDELLRAAKVAVFFIDDLQVVRPKEIGSSQLLRDHAQKAGCVIHEYELDIQFRCAGSAAFVNWVSNTLKIERNADVLWKTNDHFDFRMFDSPQSLEDAIKQKAHEGFSARMTAGFCWEWSRQPNPDGSLRCDVVIGEYRRPWNARHDAVHLSHGIPKAQFWAYDSKGIDQIGCIYTAQGFEFDYVGVIFGKDLVYNLHTGEWEGHKECSCDSEVRRSGAGFLELVKNTYRVLLSRGMKGCYVHFMDKDTETFFRSRME